MAPSINRSRSFPFFTIVVVIIKGRSWYIWTMDAVGGAVSIVVMRM